MAGHGVAHLRLTAGEIMTFYEALKIVVEDEHLEDYVYHVRDAAIADDDFEGNSWDHPRVKRFSEAVRVLKKVLDIHSDAG